MHALLPNSPLSAEPQCSFGPRNVMSSSTPPPAPFSLKLLRPRLVICARFVRLNLLFKVGFSVLEIARIKRVVWGMSDPIRGGAQSKFNILNEADLNHAVEIQTDILEEPCRLLMQEFFQTLRSRKKNRMP